jgi:hypothetical protein
MVVVVALHKRNPPPQLKLVQVKSPPSAGFCFTRKNMELNDKQLKELNDDVSEFIDKLRIHYGDDTLAIAAALTQWGLRLYKSELSTPEFAQLLVYTVETNRYL